MKLRTIQGVDFSNKRILVRVDFNVPLQDGAVTDDTRIRAVLPTLHMLLQNSDVSLILMSHLGRPKGERATQYSLRPVAHVLSTLMGQPVIMADDCVGDAIKAQAGDLKPGEILMLENVRFHPGETKNDPELAAQFASYADVYVNDAFGSCHRAHASTQGVAHIIPSYAGLLVEKEVKFFEAILHDPHHPTVAIIGGAKISTKIGVLDSLLSRCTTLVIGGGMSYTFLKAQGYAIGNSLVEDDFIDTAKELLRRAGDMNVEIVLPVDHIAASQFSPDAAPQQINEVAIPDGMIGMDIGAHTIEKIENAVEGARTIVWNGPMGVFEFDNFAQGTEAIARKLGKSDAITVIGGGDSVAAINKFDLAESIDHISTGGGASLEYLEGKTLPGIAVLMN